MRPGRTSLCPETKARAALRACPECGCFGTLSVTTLPTPEALQCFGFSDPWFQPAFMYISGPYPALHQKCSLTTLFVCEMELFGLEKALT
jgi:hypothetical protein